MTMTNQTLPLNQLQKYLRDQTTNQVFFRQYFSFFSLIVATGLTIGAVSNRSGACACGAALFLICTYELNYFAYLRSQQLYRDAFTDHTAELGNEDFYLAIKALVEKTSDKKLSEIVTITATTHSLASQLIAQDHLESKPTADSVFKIITNTQQGSDEEMANCSKKRRLLLEALIETAKAPRKGAKENTIENLDTTVLAILRITLKNTPSCLGRRIESALKKDRITPCIFGPSASFSNWPPSYPTQAFTF